MATAPVVVRGGASWPRPPRGSCSFPASRSRSPKASAAHTAVRRLSSRYSEAVTFGGDRGGRRTPPGVAARRSRLPPADFSCPSPSIRTLAPAVARRLRPAVTVDARMLKRNGRDQARGDAALVIGLGPWVRGCRRRRASTPSSRDARKRGSDLGRTAQLGRGSAEPDSARPAAQRASVHGERVVRAPAAGAFRAQASHR